MSSIPARSQADSKYVLRILVKSGKRPARGSYLGKNAVFIIFIILNSYFDFDNMLKIQKMSAFITTTIIEEMNTKTATNRPKIDSICKSVLMLFCSYITIKITKDRK
jgi:hypothetical protein